MALEAQWEEVEVVVVPPVEYRSLLDAEAAAVPFVRLRGVGVHLFLFHGEVKELPPVLPRSPHEPRVDPVVHDLEEPPPSAGVRHGLDRVRAAEIDFGDVDDIVVG